MNTDSWFILIYKTADAASQTNLADGLRTLGSLTVATEHNNGDHFVILECPGKAPALTIHDLVVTIDASADLIDTHAGWPEREISSQLHPAGRLEDVVSQSARSDDLFTA